MNEVAELDRQGISRAEIAGALGLTKKQVKDRLFRARKSGRLQDLSGGEDVRPGNRIDVDGNTATASSFGRVRTLEELLKACKVDLKVWTVDHWLANKWEVGAKDLHKSGTYKGGKFTGKVSAGGLKVEPLWQVKAWLVRKDPEPIRPVIRPINIRITPRKAVASVATRDIWLILPDPQVGFRRSLRTGILTPHHERKAMDIAVQAAGVLRPAGIVCLGDLLDLADWSDKFLRGPELQYTTQPSLLESAWWLGRLRSASPTANMSVIEGNHERRMADAIVKDLPEAYGLRGVYGMQAPPVLTVPGLLGLEDMGVAWVGDYPDGQVAITDRLVCEHGFATRSNSGATVGAMVQNVIDTRIIGHIHRIECAHRTVWTAAGPRIAAVWSVGCLCRIDGEVPGTSKRQNWQQGFGIVEVYPSGEFMVTAVPIADGRAVFWGMEFQGVDRTEELADTTGWAF